STAADLGAMAKRAGTKYLVLTHLIPALGAARQGPFKVPGGPLTEADYVRAVRDGEFTGRCADRPRSFQHPSARNPMTFAGAQDRFGRRFACDSTSSAHPLTAPLTGASSQFSSRANCCRVVFG